MQTKYYFHELPHKEKSKFFAQEGFDEFMSVRKWAVVIISSIIVVDTLLRFLVFPAVEGNKQAITISAPIFILVGSTLFYFATLLNYFQKKSVWIVRLRYCMFCVCAAGNTYFVFTSVFTSLNYAILTQKHENWTYTIIGLLNCIHSTAIMLIISPTWYFKVIIMGSAHFAVALAYWKHPTPMRGWILVKCIADMSYFTAYVVLGQYFRWKLFLKNSEVQGRNQVYNDILDRLSSLIAIVDKSGEIIYSNLTFKNMVENCENNAKSFFASIINLRTRESSNNLTYGNTAETYAYQFSKGDDHSFHENRFDTGNSLTYRNPLNKNKDSPRGIPSRFQTLEKLIQCFTDLLVKGEITSEEQVVFDAKKLNKTSSAKNIVMSYEVIIRPLLEQRKIIITLNNTTQRDLIAALEDNNQFKDQLLASVSHELRTPLNGNIGFLQVALHEESVPQNIKEKLLLPALRSGKILYHIINDILDYSKSQTEQVKPALELKPLKDTIKYCYQLLEHVFNLKNLEFKFVIDENLPVLFCTDHNRLTQVILNLLSNALKFTTRGQVTLEAKATGDLSIAEISVKDTGIGLSKKDMERLFDVQLLAKDIGDTPVSLSKGAGLGLKVANSLVKILSPEKENGIKVQSTLEEGSIFSFKINNFDKENQEGNSIGDGIGEYSQAPLSGRSPTSLPEVPFECLINTERRVKKSIISARSHRKQTEPRSATRPVAKTQVVSTYKITPTVLIVDDDLINILALQHMLAQFDIQTDVAYNGQEAIDKLVEQPSIFKAVLMDCQMPIMDGFEASKRITQKMKKGEIPVIPIIGCTAFSSTDKIEECINCGMREVMLKPVLRDRLKEVVGKYLKQNEIA